MSYKIKIKCTNINDLSFNGMRINRLIYNDIIANLNPSEDDFIKKITILYKYSQRYNIDNFVDKSLEIICNRCLTEEEFKGYIEHMYYSGFQSHNNVIVEFINTTNNETFYKYSYNLLEPVRILRRNGKYKNNSSYRVDTVYYV